MRPFIYVSTDVTFCLCDCMGDISLCLYGCDQLFVSMDVTRVYVYMHGSHYFFHLDGPLLMCFHW
jgi:hypothetical protein